MNSAFLEMRRSLQQLARDPDPERSAATCEALGAEARGVSSQHDIYYQGPRGRLKLRQEEGEPPLLIFHARSEPERGDERHYQLIGVKKPEVLVEALAANLGVEAVVAKTRRLYLWEGVRVHLDEVEGLGRFIELDARASAKHSDLSREREQLATLRKAFGIGVDDLIPERYADLLLSGLGFLRSPERDSNS